MHIYIIITKNIRYLPWNRGFWCSLNNTYPIFLTLCILCNNHLCDSRDLTDVNTYFIPSLLRMIQNADQLWRHRYKSRDVTMTDCSRVVAMDAFLAQWNRKSQHSGRPRTLLALISMFIFLNFYDPLFQHGESLVDLNLTITDLDIPSLYSLVIT